MKGSFITYLLFLLTSTLCAQETTFVAKRGSDLKAAKELNKDKGTITIGVNREFIEEYYVLKSDKTIRHGTYVRYRQTYGSIQILESGNYQNGQKVGVWEYFQDGPSRSTINGIKEKGSYVNGKRNGVWTSFYMDTIPESINRERFGSKKKTDSINIIINQRSVKLKIAGMYLNDKRVGEWESFTYTGDSFQKFNFSTQQLVYDLSIEDTLTFNTNRRALFIGGLPCLLDFLAYEFDLTNDIMSKIKNDSTSVIVSFTVDKKGTTLEPKVDLSNGSKNFENEALRVVSRMGTAWIAALSDSKTVDSINKVQFYIKGEEVSQAFKSFTLGYQVVLD